MKCTADLKFHIGLLAVILITCSAQASFEPLPVGGRAAGMGEAYSAIVDDVYSLYYNPAGVLQADRPEIGTYYSQLYVGLTDNSRISRTFLGYAQPLGKMGRNGGIGASYLALDLPGLYKEESLGITYGKEFRHIWNLGGTVKMLRKQVGTDSYTFSSVNPQTGNPGNGPDPVLAGARSATAFALDIGLQYRMAPAYALGASLRNMNSPDVGLNGTDKAPAVLNLAIARKLRQGSLDLEFMNWKSDQNTSRIMIGGEHWFKSGIGLRAGGGIGSRSYSSFSFGISYQMESFQVDYATILPLQGVEGTLGTQQISMTVRLGKPPIDPLEAQLIKEKEDRVRAETEARYAKAERDRLKKQLLSLTEEKTKAQSDREEQAANVALEEARRKEQTVQKSNQSVYSEYTAALAEFNDRVRQGIGLKEKRVLLEKILAKFEKSNVDLSTIKREMKSLAVEEARAKKDFDLSMSFYERLVEQGASAEERKSMLQRIIQKYKDSGINIKIAEDEVSRLP